LERKIIAKGKQRRAIKREHRGRKNRAGVSGTGRAKRRGPEPRSNSL